MSIIKRVTLQKIVAHDFRYDPHIIIIIIIIPDSPSDVVTLCGLEDRLSITSSDCGLLRNSRTTSRLFLYHGQRTRGIISYPLKLEAVGSTLLKQGLLEAVLHSIQLERKKRSAVAVLD